MIQHYEAYREKGLGMLAIFESPNDTLQRYVGKQPTPFPIIGDPTNHLYRLYGVEKSWVKLLTTFVQPRSLLATVREGSYATFVKGFWPGKIDGGIQRMPRTFLSDLTRSLKKPTMETIPVITFRLKQ